jgi:hypothetical protein
MSVARTTRFAKELPSTRNFVAAGVGHTNGKFVSKNKIEYTLEPRHIRKSTTRQRQAHRALCCSSIERNLVTHKKVVPHNIIKNKDPDRLVFRRRSFCALPQHTAITSSTPEYNSGLIASSVPVESRPSKFCRSALVIASASLTTSLSPTTWWASE